MLKAKKRPARSERALATRPRVRRRHKPCHQSHPVSRRVSGPVRAATSREFPATSRPESSSLISSSPRRKVSPEGGFWEYYFDNPADDNDSVEVPKVGFARIFTGSFRRRDGTEFPISFVINSGFYLELRWLQGLWRGSAGESGGSALVSEWGRRAVGLGV